MMYPYYQRQDKDSNAGRYAAPPPLDGNARFPSNFSSAPASAQAYPPLGGLQMNGGPVVSGNRMNTGQMPPTNNPAMGRYQGPNMPPGVPLQHPNMHGLHMPRSFGGNMGGVGMNSSAGAVNVPGSANSAMHQVPSGSSARQQPSSPMSNNRLVSSTSTPGARVPSNPPGTSNTSLASSLNQGTTRHVSYNMPNMTSGMRGSLPLMQQGPSGMPTNTYNSSENLLAMLNKGNILGNNGGTMPTYAQSINSKNMMNMNPMSLNGSNMPAEEQSPLDPVTDFPALPNQRSSSHQEGANKQPDLSEEEFPALPGYKNTLLSNSGTSSNSSQNSSNSSSNSTNPNNSNNSDMHNLPLPHPMHQQVHPSHLQHLQHLQQMSQLSSMTQSPVQFTNLQHHPQLSSMPQHMPQINQLSHLSQLAQLPPQQQQQQQQHQVPAQDRKEGDSNVQSSSMISSHYQPPLNNSSYASKAGLLNHPQNMVYQNAGRLNPTIHSAANSAPGNSSGTFSSYEQILPLLQNIKFSQGKKPTQDRFGLQGLMSVLKMKDPDLNTLALGTDLISLGLNLHSSEPLFTTFTSPWAPPEFVLPECYSSLSLQPALSKIPLFSEDLLFYIFYSMPRDELQLAAAQQLYNKGWRYHKETQCWFMRVHEPVVKAANHEKGSYIYFDKNSWEKVRKDNYTLLYDQLETKKEMEIANS